MSQHFETWMDAYLDEELNAQQRRQFEKHLQSCPECRLHVAKRQQLARLLQSAPAAGGLRVRSNL